MRSLRKEKKKRKKEEEELFGGVLNIVCVCVCMGVLGAGHVEEVCTGGSANKVG